MQLFLSGPVIFAGWYYGYQTTKLLELGNFQDPHEKMGLALLILYVIQLVIGLFTHFVKLRSPFGPGTRPPQNYFHVLLGLVILALAASQVRRFSRLCFWALAYMGTMKGSLWIVHRVDFCHRRRAFDTNVGQECVDCFDCGTSAITLPPCVAPRLNLRMI